MIYSVKGKLIHKETSVAVIECGGVGYACRTTFSTLSKLGEIGSDEKLFTYMSVREDCVELFGFASMQELHCFKLLISVSGIGPKAALSILSEIPCDKFAFLVAAGDNKAFTKVKGIGAKSAQRIILELKDKISKDDMFTVDAYEPSDAPMNDNVSEASAALIVLGYSTTEVTSVIASLDKSLPTEELIKQSLRLLASRK